MELKSESETWSRLGCFQFSHGIRTEFLPSIMIVRVPLSELVKIGTCLSWEGNRLVVHMTDDLLKATH